MSSDSLLKRKLFKASPLGGWGVALILIVLFVLLIRYFFIGSYRISTYSMETALHKGDYILVNKLPVRNQLKRNQIILFKSPLQRDKDNTAIIVSRCVALPGDTVHISNAGYTINGVLYPRSPHSLATYTLPLEFRESFLNLLKRLNIPQREPQERRLLPTFILTPFEEYQIREELNERINKLFVREKEESYALVVPRKGQTYQVDEGFLTASREAIIAESGQQVTFPNRKLYINGQEVNRFTFNRDYYWVLSDNMEDAVDSRHVGFVPADNIIGKAWFIFRLPI